MTEFNKKFGLRIKTERERLGLTQDQVAEAMGWNNHQTVHALEQDSRDLRAWELFKLAKLFRVSPELLIGAGELQRPFVLWRERPASGSAESENSFLKKCQDYSRLEMVDGSQRMGTRDLPRKKIDFEKWTKEDAYFLAEEIRSEMNLGRYPAESLFKTLEETYGVKFVFDELKNGGSAATSRGSFGACILLKQDEVAWRQNFSIAHELFHLITWDEDLFSNLSEVTKKRNEEFANFFSSGLLLPYDSLLVQMKSLPNEGKITDADLIATARLFGVSIQALAYRLKSLKWIDQEGLDQILANGNLKQEYSLSLGKTQRKQYWFGNRFIRLAYLAFTHGKISKARLAGFLGVSLISLDATLAEHGLAEVDGDEEISISYC